MCETDADARAEARRVLGVCNICGYCNGFCDLFDAARARPALTAGDLDMLASLCHACRNCLEACQFAPPHPFSVNVPRTLERLRWQDYSARACPPALAGLMHAPQRLVRLGIPAAILLPCLLGMWLLPWSGLFEPARMPGDFYRIVPFEVMVGLGVLTLCWALASIGISLTGYWRAISCGQPPARLSWPIVRAVLGDVARLRNLAGGSVGCTDSHTRLAPARRWLHQLLVLGLLSCLAATLVAAFWHHALKISAPYPLLSLPVLLGLLGGLLMLPASLGLLWIKRQTNPLALAPEGSAADTALILLLLAVVLTGLMLLAGRDTLAMGLLLLAHLGSVYWFFLLLPASKFVHAGYRLLALLRLQLDRQATDAPDGQNTRASSLPR